MDQKTIISALKRALDNGDGDLDDLESLLNHARADIAIAREEEQKKKQQQEDARVATITDLANRMLNNKTTSADVALVYNSYLATQGKEGTMTEESIEAGCKLANELATMWNQLNTTIVNNILDYTKELAVEENKPVCEHKKDSNDADEIIARFLKTLNNK